MTYCIYKICDYINSLVFHIPPRLQKEEDLSPKVKEKLKKGTKRHLFFTGLFFEKSYEEAVYTLFGKL